MTKRKMTADQIKNYISANQNVAPYVSKDQVEIDTKEGAARWENDQGSGVWYFELDGVELINE